MKDLNFNELRDLNGGGFSYDVGCTWRYIGHFAYGYFSSGGPVNPAASTSGYYLAEATKCK